MQSILEEFEINSTTIEGSPGVYVKSKKIASIGLRFSKGFSYHGISINVDMIGDQSAFLQDGMNVIINIYNDEPVSVIMPDSCIEEIIEADAVIKGQTVSSSFKPAILKNGIKVMVPGHIEVGTKIVVRPSDCSYIEKAKN